MLDRTPPRWVWWLVVTGTLTVAIGMVVGSWALAQGAADPRRPTTNAFEDSTFAWAGGGHLDLAPGALYHIANPHPLPARYFALDLTATLYGDPAAAWGVWLGGEGYVVIAITGEGSSGYVTARHCLSLDTPLESCATLTEPNQGIQTGWKQSLFLKNPGLANTISLLFDRGRLSLRLNREWMWDMEIDTPGQWGIWARGGQKESAISWQRAVLLW